MTDALTVIEGMAMDTDPVPVNLRVAPHGNSIVVDLGDPTGRAVLIHPGTWRIIPISPVLFRRTTLTGSLPVPDTTGPRGLPALDGLRALTNVHDDGFGQAVLRLERFFDFGVHSRSYRDDCANDAELGRALEQS